MSKRPINAVILAAGRSSRFGGDTPKCLAKVAGGELLRHSLEALSIVGFSEVTVVVGDRAKLIEDWVAATALPVAVNLIFNPDYARPSVHSVHCARHALKDGGLLLESDLIYDHRIVRELLDFDHENAMCSTFQRNRMPYFIECDDRGRVTGLGYDKIGSRREMVGIYKLSGAIVAEMLHAENIEFWDILTTTKIPIHCHACDYCWNEIDTQEDLVDARRAWENDFP